MSGPALSLQRNYVHKPAQRRVDVDVAAANPYLRPSLSNKHARFELDRHPKLPLRRESEGENVTIACSARARLDLTRYPAGTPEHEHANTVASQRQAETSPTTVQGNSSKSKALRIDRWRSWKVDSDPGGTRTRGQRIMRSRNHPSGLKNSERHEFMDKNHGRQASNTAFDDSSSECHTQVLTRNSGTDRPPPQLIEWPQRPAGSAGHVNALSMDERSRVISSVVAIRDQTSGPGGTRTRGQGIMRPRNHPSGVVTAGRSGVR